MAKNDICLGICWKSPLESSPMQASERNHAQHSRRHYLPVACIVCSVYRLTWCKHNIVIVFSWVGVAISNEVHVRGGRVLLTEILLSRIARLASNCWTGSCLSDFNKRISSKSSSWETWARKARIEKFELDQGFQPYHPHSECSLVFVHLHLLPNLDLYPYPSTYIPRLILCERQKCTIRGKGRQGIVLKHRNSLRKEPMPCRPLPLLVKLRERAPNPPTLPTSGGPGISGGIWKRGPTLATQRCQLYVYIYIYIMYSTRYVIYHTSILYWLKVV